jgi:tetratricopeptide (TPR) repeat protein
VPRFLWLAFASIFFLALPGHTQESDLLPAPKSSLVSVHWPDLTKLETDVREQLMSFQARLAATVKNPQSSEALMSEAYGSVGEIYQAYSLNTPARECYLNASRLNSQDFRWLYLLGRLDQQEDQFDEAVRHYRLARGLRPEYVAVPVNLGNISLQLNRLPEAQEDFKAALLIDDRSAAALYGLGQVALARRDYTEAVNYFEKALALAPGANRIHYSLAMAYRGLGDNEKAATHLAQQGTVGVRVSDPLFDGLQQLIKGERLHLVRGKLALDSLRYAEAADEFRKAIAANPGSVTAHINLGGVLIQTGDPEGAATQFQEVLRIDPQNANAHYNLAILMANENKHEPAIAQLQSALKIDPRDLSARFFLGQELSRAGRPAEALAEFSRIVAADPDNESALLEQVKLLQRNRQYQKALDALKQAHTRYPEKGRTAAMLAYLLAATPRYDLRDGASALELAQIVYKSTGSFEHGALVGMALAEVGRCAEAAAWLRQLIASAERQHKTDIVTKLSSDLQLYDGKQTCRPAGETAGRSMNE